MYGHHTTMQGGSNSFSVDCAAAAVPTKSSIIRPQSAATTRPGSSSMLARSPFPAPNQSTVIPNVARRTVVPANVAVKRAVAHAQRAAANHSRQRVESMWSQCGPSASGVAAAQPVSAISTLSIGSSSSSPSGANPHCHTNSLASSRSVVVRPSSALVTASPSAVLVTSSSILRPPSATPALRRRSTAAPALDDMVSNGKRPSSVFAQSNRTYTSLRDEDDRRLLPPSRATSTKSARSGVDDGTTLKKQQHVSTSHHSGRSPAYFWSLVRNSILSGALLAMAEEATIPFAGVSSASYVSNYSMGVSSSMPLGEPGLSGNEQAVRVPTLKAQPPNTIKSLALPDVLFGVPLYIPRCHVSSVVMRVFQGSPTYLTIFSKDELENDFMFNVVSAAFWVTFVNNFRPLSAGSEYTIAMFANFSYFYGLYHLRFAERHKGTASASPTGGITLSVGGRGASSIATNKSSANQAADGFSSRSTTKAVQLGTDGTASALSLPSELAWQRAMCDMLSDVLILCFDLALPADYSQVGSPEFKIKVRKDITLWLTGLPGTTPQSIDPVQAAAEREHEEQAMGKEFFDFTSKDLNATYQLQKALNEVTKHTFADILKEDEEVLRAAMDSADGLNSNSTDIDATGNVIADSGMVDGALLTRNQILQRSIQGKTLNFENAIKSIQLPELLKAYLIKHYSHHQRSGELLAQRRRANAPPGDAASPTLSPSRANGGNEDNGQGVDDQPPHHYRFQQISAGHYRINDVFAKRGLSVESLSPVFRTFLSCCVVSSLDRQTSAFNGHSRVTGPGRRSAGKNKWLWTEGGEVDKAIFQKNLQQGAYVTPCGLSEDQLPATVRQALGTELSVYQLAEQTSIDAVLGNVERSRQFHTGLRLQSAGAASNGSQHGLGCCSQGHGLLRLRANNGPPTTGAAVISATNTMMPSTETAHGQSSLTGFRNDEESVEGVSDDTSFEETLDTVLSGNDNVTCGSQALAQRTLDAAERLRGVATPHTVDSVCRSCLTTKPQISEGFGSGGSGGEGTSACAVDRFGFVLHCAVCAQTYCRKCAKAMSRKKYQQPHIASSRNTKLTPDSTARRFESSLPPSLVDKVTAPALVVAVPRSGVSPSPRVGFTSADGSIGNCITPQQVFGEMLFTPICPQTRIETNQSRVKLLVEAIKRTKLEEDRRLKIVAAHRKKMIEVIQQRNGVFMRHSRSATSDGGFQSDQDDGNGSVTNAVDALGVGGTQIPRRRTNNRPQSSPAYRSNGFTEFRRSPAGGEVRSAVGDFTFGDFLAGRRVQSLATTAALGPTPMKEGPPKQRPTTATNYRPSSSSNIGRDHFERATAQASVVAGGHARRTTGFYESGRRSVQEMVSHPPTSPTGSPKLASSASVGSIRTSPQKNADLGRSQRKRSSKVAKGAVAHGGVMDPDKTTSEALSYAKAILLDMSYSDVDEESPSSSASDDGFTGGETPFSAEVAVRLSGSTMGVASPIKKSSPSHDQSLASAAPDDMSRLPGQQQHAVAPTLTIRSMKDLRAALSGFRTGSCLASQGDPTANEGRDAFSRVVGKVHRPQSTSPSQHVDRGERRRLAPPSSNKKKKSLAPSPTHSYAATVETTAKTTLFNAQTKIARHTTATFAVHQNTHSAQVVPWTVTDPNTMVAFKRNQLEREERVGAILGRVQLISDISRESETAQRRAEKRLNTDASKAQVENLQLSKKLTSIAKSSAMAVQKNALEAVVDVMEYLLQASVFRNLLDEIYAIKRGLVTIEKCYGDVPPGTRKHLHPFVCSQRIRLKAVINAFKNANRDRSMWPKGLSSLYDIGDETEGQPLLDGAFDEPSAALPPSDDGGRSTVASHTFPTHLTPDDLLHPNVTSGEYLPASSSEDDDVGEAHTRDDRGLYALINPSSPEAVAASLGGVKPIMVPPSKEGAHVHAQFPNWVRSREILTASVYDPEADATKEAGELRRRRHIEREKLVPTMSALWESSQHAKLIDAATVAHRNKALGESSRLSEAEMIAAFHARIEELAGIVRADVSKGISTVGGALTWRESGLGVGTRANDYLLDLKRSNQLR